ncbi:MAG: hypothetical protein PF501_06295 [Salinisphaera sp.]|jgi:hypothetical protein|nr:hypothetical protein [Salinisphaera sp.]
MNKALKTRTAGTGGLAPALLLALLTVSGCAFVEPHPPRHPGPYNEPVDAFNATEVPDDPTRSSAGPNNDQLGGDLQRLHSAREAYNKDQARQAAALRRQQATCRAKPNAKTVPIQDGTNDPDAVYCQSNN